VIEWHRDVQSGITISGARIRPVLPHSNEALKNVLWGAKNPRGGLKQEVRQGLRDYAELWGAKNPRGGLKPS